MHVRYRNRYGRERSYYAAFEGVLPFLERRMNQTESEYMREKYEGYMREVPCPACRGTRLKPEILAVTLSHTTDGKNRSPTCPRCRSATRRRSSTALRWHQRKR